jgi:hypothetical protein
MKQVALCWVTKSIAHNVARLVPRLACFGASTMACACKDRWHRGTRNYDNDQTRSGTHRADVKLKGKSLNRGDSPQHLQ